jgi:hypothetical protein
VIAHDVGTTPATQAETETPAPTASRAGASIPEAKPATLKGPKASLFVTSTGNIVMAFPGIALHGWLIIAMVAFDF